MNSLNGKKNVLHFLDKKIGETNLIMVSKLCIFMMHFLKSNLNILIRNYVKLKSEKLSWYCTNGPLTIKHVREFF